MPTSPGGGPSSRAVDDPQRRRRRAAGEVDRDTAASGCRRRSTAPTGSVAIVVDVAWSSARRATVAGTAWRSTWSSTSSSRRGRTGRRCRSAAAGRRRRRRTTSPTSDGADGEHGEAVHRRGPAGCARRSGRRRPGGPRPTPRRPGPWRARRRAPGRGPVPMRWRAALPRAKRSKMRTRSPRATPGPASSTATSRNGPSVGSIEMRTGPPPWWSAFSRRLARIRSKRSLSTTAVSGPPLPPVDRRRRSAGRRSRCGRRCARTARRCRPPRCAGRSPRRRCATARGGR